MLRRTIFLIVIALIFSAAPSNAWWPRGISGVIPPPPSCPKPVDGNCIAGVAAGGLYYGAGVSGTAAGIATIQQSGQGYTIDADFNRGGIEYGIGPNILDNAMVQGTTITNGQFTGCGAYNASTATWACTYSSGPATVTLSNIHLKDVDMTITNDGNTHVIMNNITFETGPNHCLLNSGSLLSLNGVTNVELNNYKVIEGPECNSAAELWGTPAAAGMGMVQMANFTGTFSAGNGANPGIVTVSPSTTTGSIYRKSYLDWPGRFIGVCCSGTFSQYNQVLWVLTSGQGWIGTAHTVGNSTTLIIDSTDPTSPSANPPTSGCCWMSWNSTATAAHQGNFVFSCNTGAHTCTLAGAVNFSSPTAVAIGGRSCTGSGCDNAVLMVDGGLTGIGPVAITVGPLHDNNAIPFNIQGAATCVGFKSRFGFVFQMAYQIVSKAPCPIDNESDYIAMQAGSIGYADLPSGSSGVLHLDSIIQQASGGVSATISSFKQKYVTAYTTKWNFQGDLSCILCNYANSPFSTTYQITETSAIWDENMVVVNTPTNNHYNNGTGVTTGGAPFIRTLQQTFGTVKATITSGSVSNNGDGTGTLHVVSNTGTVAVGDYIKCSPSCGISGPGPMQITAQIATQPGDISTWTTSLYHALGGTVTTGSFPGKIITNSWTNMFVDTTGVGAVGPLLNDPDVPVTTNTCSTVKSLVTGASYC